MSKFGEIFNVVCRTLLLIAGVSNVIWAVAGDALNWWYLAWGAVLLLGADPERGLFASRASYERNKRHNVRQNIQGFLVARDFVSATWDGLELTCKDKDGVPWGLSEFITGSDTWKEWVNLEAQLLMMDPMFVGRGDKL